MRIHLCTLTRVALTLALLAPGLAAQRTPTSRARTPFQTLLDDHWQWSLRENPLLATTLGDHRFDRELGDLSVAAMDRRAGEAAAFLARAKAIDTTFLVAVPIMAAAFILAFFVPHVRLRTADDAMPDLDNFDAEALEAEAKLLP